MAGTDYTPREMMTLAAARQIRDGDVVFCGTGISMLAAMAAKTIHAPRSVIFFETGAIDSRLAEIPMAVADPRVMYGAASNGGLLEAFAFMQNRSTGRRVVGILGAAQIDPHGSINSTCLGDHHAPDVRFPGSGGACDVASFVPRSIIFMQHERRKFVPRLDYLTSPGHLGGPDGRRKAGLPEGGPELVVSNLGVMRFHRETRRMYLDGCFSGITASEIAERTGFPMDLSRARQVEPPTQEELRILREVCDPQRLILGR